MRGGDLAMTGGDRIAAAGLVPALAAAHFLAFVDRFLMAAAAPILAVRFQLSDWWLGVLLGPVFAVPYGIAAIMFGRRVDRGPARGFVLAGVAIWTIASVVIAVSGNTATLFAGRALVGLGQAAFVPAALVLIVARADHRSRALSIFTTSASAGRSAGLLIAGAVLALIAVLGRGVGPDGWRWMFLICALPNIMVFGVLFRVVRPFPPSIAPGGGAVRWRPGMTALIFMGGAVAPILIGQSVAAWLPVLLARGHDLTITRAATLAGLLTIVSGPGGQLLGGVLMTRSRRARRHPAVVVAGALVLGCIPLLVAGVASSLVLVTVGVTLFSLAAGISSFAALFGIQAIMPAERRGTGNGLFIALVTLVGAGAGPAMTGLFSMIWRENGAGSIGQAIGATALIAVAIALVAAIANRTRYRHAVETAAAAA